MEPSFLPCHWQVSFTTVIILTATGSSAGIFRLVTSATSVFHIPLLLGTASRARLANQVCGRLLYLSLN
jgi:hypothetical protein